MKLHKIISIVLGAVLAANVAFSASLASAAPYAVENLPDATVYNDFVVGPGKYQVELKPGESKVVNIIITNRLGKDKVFQIQTEDFRGSRDLERTVVLLDNERGPYSLKDYLSMASTTFTIGHASVLCVPSHSGFLLECLQAHIQWSPARSAVYFIGVNPLPLWLPSQKG